MRRSGSDKAGSAIRYVVLIGGALLFLLPFYLLVRNGLSTESDITSPSWKFFPTSLQWANIGELFRDPAVPMARSLVNSLVIAVMQTAGVLAISGLAGYGLARIPFRYANAVFYFIVATLLIPAAVTFVPSFVLVSTLGWVSTLRGLIVPGLFQALRRGRDRHPPPRRHLHLPPALDRPGRGEVRDQRVGATLGKQVVARCKLVSPRAAGRLSVRTE